MIEFDFPAEDKGSHACPFSGTFDEDLWIAFHGTSSLSESGIERDGFRCSEPKFSRTEIESVLSVFDELHWAGSDKDGFLVLNAFAIADFQKLSEDPFQKPCFFAETSYRALRYACQDRAGGESAHAIRRAFSDLERYLEDPNFRSSELWRSWREMKASVTGLELPTEPRSPDEVTHKDLLSLWDAHASIGVPPAGVATRPGVRPAAYSDDWLKGRLDCLRPVRERAEKELRGFTHGVVYAVRFSEEDFGHLRYDLFEGLCSLAPVPPDRIVARARISIAVASHPLEKRVWELATAGVFRLLEADGLIGRLNRRRS